MCSPCFQRLFVLYGGKWCLEVFVVLCCFLVLCVWRGDWIWSFAHCRQVFYHWAIHPDGFLLFCLETESYIELISSGRPWSWNPCAWELSLEDVFLHVENIWKILFSPQVQSWHGETTQSVQCLPHKPEDLCLIPRTHILESPAWWCRLVITRLGRLRQKDSWGSLDNQYSSRLVLGQQRTTSKRKVGYQALWASALTNYFLNSTVLTHSSPTWTIRQLKGYSS